MMKLHHLGLQTMSVMRFEEVWCDALGFKPLKRKMGNRNRVRASFRLWLHEHPEVLTYKKDDMIVELHLIKPLGRETGFDFIGVNHIALQVENRKEVVNNLPSDIEVYRYNNPGGWENISFTDHDGNFIELYE